VFSNCAITVAIVFELGVGIMLQSSHSKVGLLGRVSDALFIFGEGTYISIIFTLTFTQARFKPDRLHKNVSTANE
jgi:hypothetical protein